MPTDVTQESKVIVKPAWLEDSVAHGAPLPFAKYTVLLSPNICLTLLDLALHAFFSHFLLTGIARNRLTSLTVHLY